MRSTAKGSLERSCGTSVWRKSRFRTYLVVFFGAGEDTACADCILENELGSPTEKVDPLEAQATTDSLRCATKTTKPPEPGLVRSGRGRA